MFGGNQHCSTCRVPGCATCSSIDSDVCVECHDGDSSLSLVNGKCVCSAASYSPDHFGWCRSCNVAGCISCISSVSNFCYVCKDKTAFVDSTGQCKCPSNQAMNADGSCPVVVSSGNADFVPKTVTETGISVGAIIGIVIGGVIVLGIIVLIVVKKVLLRK